MVAIHRRVAKDECFVVLRGKVGVTTSERVEMMGKLVDLWEERKRVNQYQ